MSEESKQPSGEFKMDFSNFVLSLNASAMVHLGDIPDPNTKEREVNLPAVKHTVDILELIQEKTEGNLTEDEKKLMDDVLYDLRLKYVRATTPDEKRG